MYLVIYIRVKGLNYVTFMGDIDDFNFLISDFLKELVG